MRLINTETLEFGEFEFSVGNGKDRSPLPSYAILSHRWYDSGEVEYSHIVDNTQESQYESWQKIKSFCRVAKDRYGLAWAWVDSCCILKSSSAELTEAINAMWRLYRNASVCIVYLRDVVNISHDVLEEGDESGASDDMRGETKDFIDSDWFKRGWTLQELLAPGPGSVIFFNRNWRELGDRKTLAIHIEAATQIKDVNDPNIIANTSVAQRISWVANRKTTREEDMAYCLIGLFNLSLPIIYGEGAERAFFRLQMEILKEHDDESIFAWQQADENNSGMLATSPELFAKSSNMVRHHKFGHQRHFSMTNKGLQFHSLAQRKYLKYDPDTEEKVSVLRERIELAPECSIVASIYFVPLNCKERGSDEEEVCVALVRYGNNPQAYRDGSLVPTSMSADTLDVHTDNYDQWFHDFIVLQNPDLILQLGKDFDRVTSTFPHNPFDARQNQLRLNTAARRNKQMSA